MEIKRTINELFPGLTMPQLVLGIEKAISKSLDQHKVNNLTRNVVKERFDRCIKWAEIMRGDLGWGIDRIVASLPDMLNKELSGITYEPSKRTFWLAEDGA